MFGMRRILATAAVSVMMMAPAAQSETLADALIAAYRNSHLLDQNRAVLRAADEDVASAVSALRPVVEFTANFRRSRQIYENAGQSSGLFSTVPDEATATTNSLELSFQLLLIDFGRTHFAIEAAKEAVLATRAGLVSVEQQVLLNTVNAYVNVRLAQEIVVLRQNNSRVITQELQASRDRFDVGEVTRTDVALAESRLAQARAALTAAEGDLMVAREAYKAMTGAYPGRLSALPKAPKLPTSKDAALGIARRNHPDMIRSQHLVKAADLGVDIAKANMKPTVTLDATAGMYEGTASASSDYNLATVGITGRQTLYAGGRLSALYRKAMAQREAQRASLHQTGVSIEQNLGNAWSGLDVAAAQIAANNRQIEAAQIAFDGLREEAKLGARTTLEVLDAEQELLDARAARVQSEAERYFAVYNVLSAMGRLTVTDLNLGIPTYDVTGYYNAVKDAPATSFQGKKLDRVLQSIGKKP